MARNIQWQLYIAWNFSSYVDESERLISASGEIQYSAPEEQFSSGRGQVDGMTLVLQNSDGRYSPFNTSSPLYSLISGGKAYHAPVVLNVSNDNANYYRLFTGVIKLPQEDAPTPQGIATATIECRSKDELLLQQRFSTTLAQFQQAYAEGWTESQVINAWLEAAGVSASDRELSPGLFTIPFAWMDDESPLEEIWKLASACGGRFFASSYGKYRYESLTHWITASRSVTSNELLTERDYQALTPTYDDRELYNSITVEASPRYISPLDSLWEPDEPVAVSPGTTKVVTAHLRQPAYAISPIEYRASTPGGTDKTAAVTVVQTNYVQRVDLAITNSDTLHSVVLRPMRIKGYPVVGEPSVEETKTSAANGSNAAFFSGRGNRTRRVQGNAYIQGRAHAGMVADVMLRRFEYPRVAYALAGCLGKADRYLGDKITIQNLAMFSTNREALIISIRWRLDGSGFKQDIGAIDAGQLFPHYPSPGYFTVGTNILAGSTRIFF